MYHLHTLRHMSYMSTHRFTLRDKVTLRILKCTRINSVSSNPAKGEQKDVISII